MQSQSSKVNNLMEGKKKLFMKWALNQVRKFFNNNQLPYHPLSICVSIKPGSNNRCATLQSYPNQEVWKNLKDLPENIKFNLKTHLNIEIEKTESKFQKQILIDFQDRLSKDFDFSDFYKETNSFYNIDEIQQIDSNQNGQQVKQKKWTKGQNFVSESKQILLQMQICNNYPPLIPIKQLHYHKLNTLLEKIKECKCIMSEEMKQFQVELKKFCKQDFCRELDKKKKVKQNDDQQQYKKENEKELQKQIQKMKNQDNNFSILGKFKERIKEIEPGLPLFLPNLSEYQQPTRVFLQQMEDSYYKDLYFKEKVEQMEMNPKNILKSCKQFYQTLQYEQGLLKIEVKSDRG